jgi:hypothetical protein
VGRGKERRSLRRAKNSELANRTSASRALGTRQSPLDALSKGSYLKTMLKLPKNRKPIKIEDLLPYLLRQVDPAPTASAIMGRVKTMTSVKPARQGSQQLEAEVGVFNLIQELRLAKLPDHVILAALLKLALLHAENVQGGRVHKILRSAASEFTDLADRLDGRIPVGKVLKPNLKPKRHRSSKTKSKALTLHEMIFSSARPMGRNGSGREMRSLGFAKNSELVS